MLKERINSFKYAIKGIGLLFTEPNAKIHLGFTLLTIAGGFFFSVSNLEWCILILAIAIVLAAEALNTAVEYLTDLVSPNHHPLAGKTKDVAAGAVLIAAIGAAIIACIIFLPKIYDRFF